MPRGKSQRSLREVLENMRHRVRAAALIVRAFESPQEILLVKHRSKSRPGKIIWLPPGGGLEPEDHSIFDCARREAKEESGLTVELSRVAYIHEFRDEIHQIQHVAFYMPVDAVSGQISLDHLPADATDALTIVEAAWVERDVARSLTVYPAYLKTDEFWDDAAQDFPVTKYLGTMTEL